MYIFLGQCGMVMVSKDQCPISSRVAAVDQDIARKQTTDCETGMNDACMV